MSCARPMQRRVGGQTGFGLVILAWLVLAGCAGRADDPGGADPQDACAIGTIGPQAYRELATEVVARTPYDWPAVFAREVGGAYGEASAEITEALKIALQGRERTDAKLAAMHALMRTIGAEMTHPILDYVFSRPDDERMDLATYGYRLDVNRVGLWRPLNRWAMIFVHFRLSEDKSNVTDVHGVYYNEPSVVILKFVPKRLPPSMRRVSGGRSA